MRYANRTIEMRTQVLRSSSIFVGKGDGEDDRAGSTSMSATRIGSHSRQSGESVERHVKRLPAISSGKRDGGAQSGWS